MVASPLSPIIQNLGSHPQKLIVLSSSLSFLLKFHQLHPLKSSEIYPFLLIFLTYISSASLFTLIIARVSFPAGLLFLGLVFLFPYSYQCYALKYKCDCYSCPRSLSGTQLLSECGSDASTCRWWLLSC